MYSEEMMFKEKENAISAQYFVELQPLSTFFFPRKVHYNPNTVDKTFCSVNNCWIYYKQTLSGWPQSWLKLWIFFPSLILHSTFSPANALPCIYICSVQLLYPNNKSAWKGEEEEIGMSGDQVDFLCTKTGLWADGKGIEAWRGVNSFPCFLFVAT